MHGEAGSEAEGRQRCHGERDMRRVGEGEKAFEAELALGLGLPFARVQLVPVAIEGDRPGSVERGKVAAEASIALPAVRSEPGRCLHSSAERQRERDQDGDGDSVDAGARARPDRYGAIRIGWVGV